MIKLNYVYKVVDFIWGKVLKDDKEKKIVLRYQTNQLNGKLILLTDSGLGFKGAVLSWSALTCKDEVKIYQVTFGDRETTCNLQFFKK